jgi:hypothetical protein
MHRTTDESGEAAAVDFASRIVPFCQAEIGSELLGAYLIGSLAHGGFSRRYSDVDVAWSRRPDPADLDRAKQQWRFGRLGTQVSIFWTDRHSASISLDRIDYLDHGVVLMEREHVQPARPALEEIQCYLAGAPLAGWTEQVRRFATAETLEPKDHKPFLRTLLYPGRFCFSWMTGRMGSNDDAVAFLGQERPARLDLNLITRALQCRQAGGDPDSLFPARMTLPSQVDACAALAGLRSQV